MGQRRQNGSGGTCTWPVAALAAVGLALGVPMGCESPGAERAPDRADARTPDAAAAVGDLATDGAPPGPDAPDGADASSDLGPERDMAPLLDLAHASDTAHALDLAPGPRDLAPDDLGAETGDLRPRPADLSSADVETGAGDVEPDGCVPVDGAPQLDRWGGDARVVLEATGFFRTERLCGRWWLVTPEGHPFYSLGVNATGPRGEASQVDGRRPYEESVRALYPDMEAWADEATRRLRSWGLNTAGAWSDNGLLGPRMAYTPILYLAGSDWERGTLPDYFAPAWEASVAQRAAQVERWVDDPNVLGYFLDNELRWGAHWRGAATLLQV